MKIKIFIMFVVFYAQMASACPLCWGNRDGQDFDFKNSNYPEKVKKYFPGSQGAAVAPPPEKKFDCPPDSKFCDSN